MSGRVLVVLARSKSWYAPLITAITDTWFNHVFFVYVDSKFGGWMALDILKSGPVVLPVERAMKRYKRIECFEYKGGDLWSGIRKSKKDLGSGYDWLGLTTSIFKLLLFKMFRLKWLNPIHWATKYICFEWVLTVMRRAEVKGGSNLDPILIPPADFKDFIERHEDFEVVKPPAAVWKD